MSTYRFHLQKYKSGRNSKLTCPQCGRKQCFVRYIDEEGKITFLDYVGRCDHEDSCGYHYTPKDLFQDKPDMKPNNDDDWRGQRPSLLLRLISQLTSCERHFPITA